MKVQWKPGPALAASGELLRLHAHASEPRHVSRRFERRRRHARDGRAGRELDLLHPYHMHGSIGVSCAVADVKADSATIWSPTQGVYPQRDSVAMLLGMPSER